MHAISMSVSDACRFIGIGRTKLYELINTGKIETTKIGKRTLVRTDSLTRLISGEAL